MELIADSVKNASARIRFFRIAFGAASNQQVGPQEVISVLDDMYAGTRVSVVWGPQDGLPRDTVRLAFLALLCLETGMPFGGRIEVSFAEGQLVMKGHADKFTIDPALWGLLEGAIYEEKLLPAQLQFGLLPHLSQKSDRKLSIVKDENLITMTI
ncbi:histidine phosphotransferase family protein [Sulfitobacter donghicola]|nr:histidine phosphotransferase family protein [Sulfitobacter donghicola]